MTEIADMTDDKLDMPPATRSEFGSSELSSVDLPRHVSGGFKGVTDDLDQQSRDTTTMVRLLEQQRLQLETAERERSRLLQLHESIVPRARDTGRALDDATERTKSGDVTGNLSGRFADAFHEIDQLENTARALTANLLSLRSCWEQYARTMLAAHKMREKRRL